MGVELKKVELLSPAGTYECFEAAMLAGADAIYLGLKDFGARRNAGNFSEDELLKAIDEAHLRSIKIYLTVNTLFKDNEFEELYKALINPYVYGLDGVIVQDIGVITFIKNSFPGLEVHASTQMAITDLAGAEFAKSLGMERIVPARELTLKEIKNIHDNTNIEIECFIHGAMCYSYSGKCLFSSFLGGRSGNRGLCAQPCRLMYNDTYLLSMKDLCTLENIPELIDAGIDSFKIEGRMKSPEYVYNVTRIYRKYIDLYYSDEKFVVDKKDMEQLISLYTRGGNCNGYLFEKNNKNIITFSNPSYSSDANNKSDTVTEKEFKNIDTNIRVVIKEEACVRVDYEYTTKENTVKKSMLFDDIPQKAINSALTEEIVKKQFNKTGGTCINVKHMDIDLDDNLFMPNGQLNRIRRDLIEDIRKNILIIKRRNSDNIRYFTIQNEIDSKALEKEEYNTSIRLKTLVSNVEQLKAVVLFDKITVVIIPLSLFIQLSEGNSANNLFDSIKTKHINIYIFLPYIIRDINKGTSQKKLIDSINKLENGLLIAGINIKGYYISNYESLFILNTLGINKEIIGDIHLYATNKYASFALKQLNVKTNIVPIELNLHELEKRGIDREEFIIYGRIPMMISSSCIVNSLKKCSYNENGHFLYINDRKNSKLPVRCVCSECINVIYNSVPTSLAGELDNIRRINPSAYRLDFVDESYSDVEKIITEVCTRLENLAIDKKSELVSEYTKGHFKKGVL